jgi:5-oxoprolinase (ATP-hydrolysing) subunit A
MLNTGTMEAVDLNADLAEGETLTAADRAVLEVVTSANLACGFHAGNRALMREAAAVCHDRGIAIGAHVSYRDREGFGRRVVERAPELLVGDIVEQCTALTEEAGVVGGRVEYVKPHGALYHRMGVDPSVAAAVVDAVRHGPAPVLVAQPGTVVVEAARQAGVRVVFEGFPDRGYLASGALTDRGGPGAVIDDPATVAARARSLVERGGVAAVDGAWTRVEVDTLCIHGDTPGAAAAARAVRSALEAAGILVRSFLSSDPGTAERSP